MNNQPQSTTTFPSPPSEKKIFVTYGTKGFLFNKHTHTNTFTTDLWPVPSLLR